MTERAGLRQFAEVFGKGVDDAACYGIAGEVRYGLQAAALQQYR